MTCPNGPRWSDFIGINAAQIPGEIASALWIRQWAAACNSDQRNSEPGAGECPPCHEKKKKKGLSD